MDYLHVFTKYMDRSWTFLVFISSCFTVTKSQLGKGGLCSISFGNGGQSGQRNILSVCTSSISNKTGTIFFDMDSVPLLDQSKCVCTVTFEKEQLNNVFLELTLGNRQNGVISISGFGATLSSSPSVTSFSISTIQQVNDLRFDLTATNRRMQACLKIQEATPNNSLFQTRCFRRGQTPISETTGTGEPSDDSGKGALIGGIIGGVIFIIVVVIVVIIICLYKRKQIPTKSTDKEDYYITENAMYNQPNGLMPKSSGNQPSTKYETVDVGDQNRGSDVKKNDSDEYYLTENAMYKPFNTLQRSTSNQLSLNYEVVGDGNQNNGNDVYSEIDKGKNVAKMDKEMNEVQSKPEDQYNHLNELSSRNVTGNVYSSVGNRGVQKDKDNVYSEIDRGKVVTEVDKETNGVQSKPEDEYNHLNELSSRNVTGNVYSSVGNQRMQKDKDNLYDSASQSDSKGVEIHDTGNIYNKINEAT